MAKISSFHFVYWCLSHVSQFPFSSNLVIYSTPGVNLLFISLSSDNRNLMLYLFQTGVTEFPGGITRKHGPVCLLTAGLGMGVTIYGQQNAPLHLSLSYISLSVPSPLPSSGSPNEALSLTIVEAKGADRALGAVKSSINLWGPFPALRSFITRVGNPVA